MSGEKDVERAHQKTRSLATFAIRRNSHGSQVRIIGYSRYTPGNQGYDPSTSGTVLLQGERFPIIEPQNAVRNNMTITDDSCIVILDSDASYSRFGKAIMVKDIWELFEMVHEKKRTEESVN